MDRGEIANDHVQASLIDALIANEKDPGMPRRARVCRTMRDCGIPPIMT
jgi:hypothetical protein